MDAPDAQAVRAAATGDADAFLVLVRRYRAPLIAHIHGRTRARDGAEDLAQDVFCKAWQHLPRLREPSAFPGWLFRIADNVIVTASRRKPPVSLDGDPPGPCEEPRTHDNASVHAAVSSLTESQRVVVMLHHFTGLPTDDVARVLGVAPATVRSRLSRAYGELRQRLQVRAEV